MEKLGTYSVMEFRAVCKMSNIPATSTGCIALRAKFKRVFADTGTKREVAHVVALLKLLGTDILQMTRTGVHSSDFPASPEARREVPAGDPWHRWEMYFRKIRPSATSTRFTEDPRPSYYVLL